MPARVYRIDQLKPKGYLSQIDDLTEDELAVLDEQRSVSRQLFSLLIEPAEGKSELARRRQAQQESLLRERLHLLGVAAEAIFAARGRHVYLDITGYTEHVLLEESRGLPEPAHQRHYCYLCEPMRTLGWSRRRALGEASLALYLQVHGSRVEGDLLAALEERRAAQGLGPVSPKGLSGLDGLAVLTQVVREGLVTLIREVLAPHLASWQGAPGAARAIRGADRHLLATSIARLLVQNTRSK